VQDDFYKTAHKKIFEAIIALFNRGEAIDLLTVTEELRTRGELASAGGAGVRIFPDFSGSRQAPTLNTMLKD